MANEMPTVYDFTVTEQRIYQWWEESGWFKPEIAGPDAEPFVISIPPPNVTGELHVGHAMFVSVEDLMIRYHRMRGYAALWVPGADHAGIATQLQVEKMLRDEGTSRQAIGREEFLRRTWEWKAKYGGHITRQLRRLGASCDWDRERFTLDDGLSRAVREAFVRLYRMGLIYQGEYLVNWSPGLQTAVSDLEVEYSEEKGTLYYFKYPIAGSELDRGPGEGYIPVATTRPETILGDTAVAVHPDDERFRHLIGKTCLVPMLNRPIPVIHDTYVDMEFGTGALKITPGHDPNDFEIGQRHGLQIINALETDATMSSEAGPYAGMDRFECRAKLWADMEAAGLTIKTEAYEMTIPRSQRGGEIVEPMVSRQWFVNVAPMAEAGLAAVRSGRIRIVPKRFEKVYYNWLENIRPWCISRQLWWGHRIPVWYCDACGHLTVPIEDPDQCEACGSTQLRQDPDVLDTWFSSALWPFSTLGWPDETDDLRRFFPTSVMETGYDILFFWVARMIMTSLLFTNDIPFHTVYLHGMVHDDQGRKMSKTAGNVVDPITVMDGAAAEELSDYVRSQYPDGLPPMGTDALRFTMLTGSSPGNDLNISVQRVEGNRNFTNKIWNATRFTVGKLAAVPDLHLPEAEIQWSLADRWIRSRLNRTVGEVTRLFEAFQYGEAGRQLYDFFWSEFADWYIEIAKAQIDQGGIAAYSAGKTLVYILEQTLRMLHPFIPFVTEETWGHLKRAAGDGFAPTEGWADGLMIAAWPEAGAVDEAAEVDMNLIIDLIRGIRNVRSEYQVQPGRRIAALISAGDQTDVIDGQRDALVQMARLNGDELLIASEIDPPDKVSSIIVGGVVCYLPLADLVDLAAESERLAKELAEVEAMIARSEKQLAGPFAQRAPAPVVERERNKLADLKVRHEQLNERLMALH
ncbi:MAG: valine--tRNA ligase [Anaerolineae bacterium]|jgi:valyl-tRNA synthetase